MYKIGILLCSRYSDASAVLTNFTSTCGAPRLFLITCNAHAATAEAARLQALPEAERAAAAGERRHQEAEREATRAVAAEQCAAAGVARQRAEGDAEGARVELESFKAQVLCSLSPACRRVLQVIQVLLCKCPCQCVANIRCTRQWAHLMLAWPLLMDRQVELQGCTCYAQLHFDRFAPEHHVTGRGDPVFCCPGQMLEKGAVITQAIKSLQGAARGCMGCHQRMAAPQQQSGLGLSLEFGRRQAAADGAVGASAHVNV
jgi:hypothetical protein